MKYPSTIPRLYAFVAHFFLLSEQILGAWLFARALGRAKNLFMRRLTKNRRGCPRPVEIPVERVENLTAERFRRDYFSKGRAVIFAGAAKRWPCCLKWDLDYFSIAHGESDLLIVQSEGLTTREKSSEHEFLTVRELTRDIRQGGERYLRFSPLLHDNPILAEDLALEWLSEMRGGSTFGNTYYMFMSGAGQKTYLHADQPCNLYVQIYGEKKWTLFYPRDSVALYPAVTNSAYVKSPVNMDDPDWERHPLFASAQPFVAHLKPGDVMYVPPHVWHQVENLTATIAVGYRFSSLRAAMKSSAAFSLIRILSTNPPVWKTKKYGKMDTNLIWAHSTGKIKQVLREREERLARGHERHP